MNDSDKIWKNRSIEHLITDLRNEASDQKKCITEYTLKVIAFTAAAWAFMLKMLCQKTQFICAGFLF